MGVTEKKPDHPYRRLLEIGALEWNRPVVESAIQMIDELEPEPRSYYYRALTEYRLSLFHMRKGRVPSRYR